MRPVRLVVDGLTCFREPQTVDFAGLGVVAIAGPTGAGKSSLLDAMILALYGVVPRMGKRGVAELIAHGRKSLAVTFDFRVVDKSYRVTRRVAAEGKAGAAILSELVGDAEVKRASGIEEVKKAIRELIGIDAGAFTQAVILPQGEFQQFLKSEPAARRRTLNTLLGLGVYEDMRQRADQVAKARRAEIEGLARRLEGEWAQVTPSAVAAIDKELSEVAAAVPALETERDRAESELARLREEAALTAELGQDRGALGGARGRAGRHGRARRPRPDRAPGGADPAAPRRRRARRGRAGRGRAAGDARRGERRRGADARGRARERGGRGARRSRGSSTAGASRSAPSTARAATSSGARSCARRALRPPSAAARPSPSTPRRSSARGLAGVAAQLGSARKALATAQEALAKEERQAQLRRTKEAEAADARSKAEVAEARARELLRLADHEHRAAALRSELVHGEACPVCAQVVAELPPAPRRARPRRRPQRRRQGPHRRRRGPHRGTECAREGRRGRPRRRAPGRRGRAPRRSRSEPGSAARAARARPRRRPTRPSRRASPPGRPRSRPPSWPSSSGGWRLRGARPDRPPRRARAPRALRRSRPARGRGGAGPGRAGAGAGRGRP
ncbi:MAG: SMC family ATPase [Myxococcota bacterium]